MKILLGFFQQQLSYTASEFFRPFSECFFSIHLQLGFGYIV